MHSRDDRVEVPLRPLDTREREVLEFLLSPEVEGVEELRAQADHVLARSWSCGCASIDLIVERGAAASSPVAGRPAIEATTIEREDAERAFDLLLWVEDGFLSGIEIVDYGEIHGEQTKAFPPPDAFDPPRAFVVPGQ